MKKKLITDLNAIMYIFYRVKIIIMPVELKVRKLAEHFIYSAFLLLKYYFSNTNFLYNS